MQSEPVRHTYQLVFVLTWRLTPTTDRCVIGNGLVFFRILNKPIRSVYTLLYFWLIQCRELASVCARNKLLPVHEKSAHKSSKFMSPFPDAVTKRNRPIWFLNCRTSHSLLRMISRHSSARAFRTTCPFTRSSTRIFPMSQPPPRRNDIFGPMMRNFGEVSVSSG